MPHDAYTSGQPVSRRTVLKGVAGSAATFTAASMLGISREHALADESVRAQILQIPGAGKGQPTEADMQKVGELCLGSAKAVIKQDEFNGVESGSWDSITRICTTLSSAHF